MIHPIATKEGPSSRMFCSGRHDENARINQARESTDSVRVQREIDFAMTEIVAL